MKLYTHSMSLPLPKTFLEMPFQASHAFKYVLSRHIFIFSGMGLSFGNSRVIIGATGV